nr:RnfABCDGE type electron transport complex subunit D [Brucepastera parasyntrophica]
MKKMGLLVSPSPFILTRPTVVHMSVITAVSLLPQIIILFVLRDFSALLTIISAVLGSVFAELGVCIVRKKNTFTDGTVLLTGLLAGFLLPTTLSFLTVFCICFFGICTARIFLEERVYTG